MDSPDPDAAGARPLVDAASLRARIEDSRARIAAVETRARAARTELAGATTTVTGADHAVTVTVNAAGTLLDLAFAGPAQKLPLPALARSVLATYRQATAEAAGHTEDVLRDLLGEHADPALQLLRAGLAEPDAER